MASPEHGCGNATGDTGEHDPGPHRVEGTHRSEPADQQHHPDDWGKDHHGPTARIAKDHAQRLHEA